MKSFLLRCTLFLALTAALLHAKPLSFLSTGAYRDLVTGREVYVSLQKSKSATRERVLVLSDSVANQLFSNRTFNGEIYSLACNQMIDCAEAYGSTVTLVAPPVSEGRKREVAALQRAASRAMACKTSSPPILTTCYFFP